MNTNRNRIALSVGALALVVASAAACQSSSGSATPAGPLAHETDYTVTTCTVDSIDYPHAGVTIVNHSSKTSDYIGTVRFESQDGKTQYGTGAIFASHVTPGQTTNVDAIGTQTVATGSHPRCVLASADRMASN